MSFSEPCDAGQRLDQVDGCVNCPEDEWSVAENTSPSCAACPEGKGVPAGQGKQENDCTWSKLDFLYVKAIKLSTLMSICTCTTATDLLITWKLIANKMRFLFCDWFIVRKVLNWSMQCTIGKLCKFQHK